MSARKWTLRLQPKLGLINCDDALVSTFWKETVRVDHCVATEHCAGVGHEPCRRASSLDAIQAHKRERLKKVSKRVISLVKLLNRTYLYIPKYLQQILNGRR